jgi:hypothetical protein
MKNHKYKLTVTHNPQDFYNGIEPPELSKSYDTEELETDVDYELSSGYQVIVSRVDGDSSA